MIAVEHNQSLSNKASVTRCDSEKLVYISHGLLYNIFYLSLPR